MAGVGDGGTIQSIIGRHKTAHSLSTEHNRTYLFILPPHDATEITVACPISFTAVSLLLSSTYSTLSKFKASHFTGLDNNGQGIWTREERILYFPHSRVLIRLSFYLLQVVAPFLCGKL